MKEIRYCQKEIAATDPHPYYLTAYRDEEIRYWLYISKWLSELKKSRFQVRRVLDIGCGFGTLALLCRLMFDCELYCTDMNDGYLSTALRDKYDLNYAVNNIERDDFPWPLQFDIIIFSEVIEHLNFSPIPSLQKIRGLLAPNGKVLLSTPDAKKWGRTTRYYERFDDIPWPTASTPLVDDHVWHYTKDELLNVIHSSGFRIDKHRYSPGATNRHFNLQLSINTPD